MKPDYQRGPVSLYCGDCLEVLPTLERGSVDAVVTDPPYNAKTHSGARAGSHRTAKEIHRPLDIGFETIAPAELRRIFTLCHPQRWLVATMAYQHAVALEGEPPSGLEWIRFGIWRKPNAAPQFSGDRPGCGWEAVGILHRAGVRKRWNGGGKHAVWTHRIDRSNKGKPWGPTAKPVPLLVDFIEDFTDPGETVLDPFAGFGSTAIAAIRTDRSFIGAEINRAYFDIATRRIDAELDQKRLPFPPQT